MTFRKVTAICLALATVPSVSAVTLDIKWLGGSGTWSTSGNWDTDSLPGGNNHVQIDPLNASTVTVSVDVAATARSHHRYQRHGLHRQQPEPQPGRPKRYRFDRAQCGILPRP
ncbi:MAG: hypothetical protein QNK90_17005 [Opitutaceae bacterium]